MKQTKRKAFNFLRSYFDVLNEIQSDEDKLAFLMAVINKQFLDEDPELEGISKFAYISQINAIESSVNGYKDKMKTDVFGNKLKPSELNPSQGGKVGGRQAPCQQEKEKGEEEEKEKGKEKEPILHWNRTLKTGLE